MVQLRPDMSPDIIVTLVQVKDRMDMEIVLATPFHQQTNHFSRLI